MSAITMPTFRGPIPALRLAIAVALGLLFAGCSRTPTKTPNLVVLGEDSSNLNAIESLAPAFQASSGIPVSFDKSSFEVSNQKAAQDLMRGTGLYDILLQYNFSLSSFVANNWVVTFDELRTIVPNFDSRRSFESNLFQNAWREVGFYKMPKSDRELIVGYPFASNTMLLAYNRLLFEDRLKRAAFERRYHRQLTVPVSWPEFRDVAEFFTDPGSGTHGVALQGATGGWLYYEWASVAFNMGGGVMKKARGWEGDLATPVLLDSAGSIEATKLYLSLKPYNAGDFFSTGGLEQRELMKTGKVAMAVMWSDYIWPLVQGPEGKRFGFASIPGRLSGLAGGSFFINKRSRSKKEAAELILYLMQMDRQIELVKHGLCSPLKPVYDDPGVRAAVPYAAALSKSLERGVYFFEAGPDAEAVQQVITKWLQAMWKGDVDATVGLRSARAEMQTARAKIFQRLERQPTQ